MSVSSGRCQWARAALLATHCCNQLVHPFQHTFFSEAIIGMAISTDTGKKLGGQLGFGEITDTLSSIQELTDLMLMFLLARMSLHLHSLW